MGAVQDLPRLPHSERIGTRLGLGSAAVHEHGLNPRRRHLDIQTRVISSLKGNSLSPSFLSDGGILAVSGRECAKTVIPARFPTSKRLQHKRPGIAIDFFDHDWIHVLLLNFSAGIIIF